MTHCHFYRSALRCLKRVDSVWLRTSTTAANAPWAPGDADGPQRVDDPLVPRGRISSVALALSPRADELGTPAKMAAVWSGSGPSINATGDVLVGWCDRPASSGACSSLATRRFD